MNREFRAKMGKSLSFFAKKLSESQSRKAFTLVELMTAMAVLVLVLGIIATATNYARTTMQRSQVEIGAFAVARSAFEDMSDKLSQATLNTYWDYYNSAGLSRGAVVDYNFANGVGTSTSIPFTPSTYGRASDLHFLIRQNTQQIYCGQEVYFQTPVAYSPTSNYQDTQGLLNSGGFYVEYCPDTYRPSPLVTTVTNKWRYRLMQGLEPTEKFSVYSNMTTVLATESAPTSTSWTWMNNIQNENTGGIGAASGTISPNAVPIADNVIALIVWPREPLRMDAVGYNLAVTPATPTYPYDSQADMNKLPTSTSLQNLYDEQLPPIIQLTVVVIDEASAARIATNTKTEPTQISTAFANAKTGAAPLFTNEANYNNDLANLTTQLALAKINYRVMSTYVVMRESKWSQ